MRDELIAEVKKRGRSLRTASGNEETLGPLSELVGEWNNDILDGHGWNMIALPFKANGQDGFNFNYRLLLNQYNETLTFFDEFDDGVPNRGVEPSQGAGPVVEADQTLAALDYEQVIHQLHAEDFPVSGEAGGPKLPIHHEPGLWLHMFDQRTNNIDIARLATIPHGNSVLALGHSASISGPPQIANISGLPINVSQDLNSDYLRPYKHFHDQPFRGVFDPVTPNALLMQANSQVKILKTTVLDVDSTLETGGIVNIPFVTRQADAAEMKSTFWIMDVETKEGQRQKRLQYTQTVMLDFFKNPAGEVIRWPHVSINTMTKKE